MKKLIIFSLLSFLLLPVFSQDATVLTAILQKEKANYIDFSYMIASELGRDGTPFEAYTYCDRYGNYKFTDVADKPISVKTVSYFLMSNYNIKGGIMWSAFKNPRYAYKELKKTGFWPQGTDPDMTLSGRDLLRAISRFFAAYPNSKLNNPPTQEATAVQRKALLADKETVK